MTDFIKITPKNKKLLKSSKVRNYFKYVSKRINEMFDASWKEIPGTNFEMCSLTGLIREKEIK
jgi:hypothetical protein